jgi:nitrate reductase NapAB chaperone NapD
VKEKREVLMRLEEKGEEGKEAGRELREELREEKLSQISSCLLEEELKKNSGKEMMEKIEKELSNFKKTLMLREAQLGMLIYVTEMKHDKDFIQNYSNIY